MDKKYQTMQYNDSALIEHYRDMIKDHYLVCVDENHYQLRRNDRHYYMTDITYVPHVGVIISGDLSPQHELGGTIGKCALELFATKCDPDYIASKFLPKGVFDESRAEVELAAMINSQEDYGFSDDTIERLRGIFYSFFDGYDFDVHGFNVCFKHLIMDGVIDSVPGYGYNLDDYALLAAINEKFAELYARYKAAE